MKKIILGTLFFLTVGMGFGFAETQTKETKNYNKDYYRGYKNAAKDYEDKKYNPSSCNKQGSEENAYNCIRGYQDSWERSSEVAPRTSNENSNNQ